MVPKISLVLLVVSILFVGTLNTLSYKVLYTVYSQRYAYFVSNGINVLYVVFGGMLLYPRMYCNRSGRVPEEVRLRKDEIAQR